MNSGERTPRRHPSAATLLAHASGSLGIAHQFVVATHAMNCTECYSAIRTAEHIGGILLDGLTPTALRRDALQRCLVWLDKPETTSRADRPAHLAPHVGELILPPTLRGFQPGNLRWLAPGIRHATLFRDKRSALHFLRMRANVVLPEHSHRGLELACVLQGACHDESGHYFVGDVSEMGEVDEETPQHGGGEHLVVADPPGDCICILATSGRLRFRSWLTRLLQPLLPF